MKEYVLGFMFCDDCQIVALIRKDRPAWQAGKLNGIGGKIEPDDSGPHGAMVREFEEETGAKTAFGQWRKFAEMEGEDFDGQGIYRVHCFVTVGDVEALDSVTSEEVELHPIGDLHRFARWDKTVANLTWLASLAQTVALGTGPNFTLINYNPPKAS